MVGQSRCKNLSVVHAFVQATVKRPEMYSSVASVYIQDQQIEVAAVLTEFGIRRIHEMRHGLTHNRMLHLKLDKVGSCTARLSFNLLDFVIYCAAHGETVRDLYYNKPENDDA